MALYTLIKYFNMNLLKEILGFLIQYEGEYQFIYIMLRTIHYFFY
jgi:hypothetical protein